MSEWISVDDKLPEKSGQYLTCYMLDGTYTCEVYQYSAVHKLWNAYDGFSLKSAKRNALEVDYWMPLPEAPKTELRATRE